MFSTPLQQDRPLGDHPSGQLDGISPDPTTPVHPEPRSWWRAAPPRTPHSGLAPEDVEPPSNWSGALGRVILSTDARSWLMFLAERPDDDPDDPCYSRTDEPVMPEHFQLGPTWQPDSWSFARDIVDLAFELSLLQGPQALQNLTIDAPYVATHGCDVFRVVIAWHGLRASLTLSSRMLRLRDLAPDDTAVGIEAALILLQTVATAASELLDNLAAEGARPAEYWWDAQADAEEAATERWRQRHPGWRLRRWLRRNLSIRRGSASRGITVPPPGMMSAIDLTPTQQARANAAPETTSSRGHSDDVTAPVTGTH